MQLGSRFSVGQAPTSLPEGLRERITTIEATLTSEQATTLRWTLTWLEGRAILELDDGQVLKG
jgi:hypothetical protein